MAQLCSSAIGLSSESRGWAQAANYTWTNDEDGTVVLSSAVGGSTRYYIRARGSHRLELRESFTPHTSWRLKLFVSDAGVLERHLISLLGEVSVTGLAGPVWSQNVRFEWLHRDSPGRLCQV